MTTISVQIKKIDGWWSIKINHFNVTKKLHN